MVKQKRSVIAVGLLASTIKLISLSCPSWGGTVEKWVVRWTPTTTEWSGITVLYSWARHFEKAVFLGFLSKPNFI